MKKIHTIVFASAFAMSTTLAFAADTNTTIAPGGTTTTPQTQKGTTGKPTHAEREAQERTIDKNAENAELSCNSLSGAEKAACKKDIESREKAMKEQPEKGKK
jgi:ATP-dependent protease ClpP protease subunit